MPNNIGGNGSLANEICKDLKTANYRLKITVAVLAVIAAGLSLQLYGTVNGGMHNGRRNK